MPELQRYRTEEERRPRSKEGMKEYTNTAINNAIDEYVHSERDRYIMKRRLVDGICYEPLAEEVDMSVSQIKRIIHKHECSIFDHI